MGHDNDLAMELESQHREGDPLVEGVIWARVGEIAVVEGLGCREFLLQLMLEEMKATNNYDYVVVQATRSTAPIYQRFGFVRVGAIARYGPPPSEADEVG